MTSSNTRIKVRAIRAANGRIQTWAVEHNNWEIGTCHQHADAMTLAHWWGHHLGVRERKAKGRRAFETP